MKRFRRLFPLPLAAMAIACALASVFAHDEPAGDSPEEISNLEQASRLLEEVRGLTFKTPVEEKVLDQAQLAEELNRLMNEEMSVEQEAELVKLLARLGLIPEDYDLRSGMLEMLVYQVAGFYEPRSKTMVTVPAVEKEEEDDPVLLGVDQDLLDQMILVHELDHALTDQYFDLAAMFDNSDPISRDDRRMARHSLAEGDAMLAMMLAQMRGLGVTLAPEQFPLELMSGALAELAGEELVPGADDLPRYLQDQLIQPYLLGFDLVARTWKQGGWDAVNALWENPPESTEQLLHPDRADDAPQQVELPRKDRRARAVFDAEMGELGVRTWLELHLDPESASTAAEGWDGDRVGLYRRKRNDAEHAVWDTVWDDGGHATEFSEAARAWFAKAQIDGEVEQDGTFVRLRF